MPATPIASNDQLMYARAPLPKVPVFVTDKGNSGKWVKPVEGKPMTFQTVGAGQPNDVTLVPFYTVNRERYAVYLDTFTPEAWKQKQVALDAQRQQEAALEARTLDEVSAAEQQPEQDHHYKGQGSNHGLLGDRGWRDAAAPSGWFSYELKVDAKQPTDLLCTYWGSETGNRNFDIQVDGKTIANQRLDMNKPEPVLQRHVRDPGRADQRQADGHREVRLPRRHCRRVIRVPDDESVSDAMVCWDVAPLAGRLNGTWGDESPCLRFHALFRRVFVGVVHGTDNVFVCVEKYFSRGLAPHCRESIVFL